MKILHVTEAAIGGTSTVIRLNMLGQIKQLGKGNVTALVPEREAQYILPVPQECIETYSQTGRNLRSFYALAISFYNKIKRDKPDIIHLHSSFAGLICRLVLIPAKITILKYRPRIIYCPHAFGFLMEGAAWKKKLYAFIERILATLTDVILCVGHYERDLAIEYGLPEHKLHVVSNGVPVPEINSINNDNDNNSDVIQLLFIGRLDYQKGFDILLKAMAELEGEPFHLTVVGSAQRSNEDQRTHPNINYTGWVNADQIPQYIKSCDALVMPSRWEGLAMVPLEAMMLGKALAASDIGSIKEVIVNGKTGKLFPVNQVDTLISILRSTSKNEWEQLGQAARKHIEVKYSDAKMVERTMELYKINQ